MEPKLGSRAWPKTDGQRQVMTCTEDKGEQKAYWLVPEICSSSSSCCPCPVLHFFANRFYPSRFFCPPQNVGHSTSTSSSACRAAPHVAPNAVLGRGFSWRFVRLALAIQLLWQVSGGARLPVGPESTRHRRDVTALPVQQLSALPSLTARKPGMESR